MTAEVRIGRRTVGAGNPCVVIAEAGVNHNGDLDLALQLVDAAANAGADIVKFQLFRASEVASAAAPKAEYQVSSTGSKTSQLEMLTSLELPQESFAQLADAAAAQRIGFLCTAYSLDGLDYLDAIGVPAFKFASAQIVESPLIEHAAAKGKPLILSTGMATLGEIDEAFAFTNGAPLVLLQCTTDYPSVLEDANLRTIPALAERYDVPVGYSDHTIGSVAAIASVVLGAAMIEKHLTLDRNMDGPDHSASLDPRGFADFVKDVRAAEAALGSGMKAPTQAELANAPVMRRSLHAARTISAGMPLSANDVALKRPYVGLPPRDLPGLLGKRARQDIAQDTPLSLGLFE